MAKKKAKSADGEASKAPKKGKSTAKKAAKEKEARRPNSGRPRSSKKELVESRKKLYWGVFNHALKRVALFEFNQKKAAQKRAEELSEGGKHPHFVQKVKEDVTASAVSTE